jgi:hypothetical protein
VARPARPPIRSAASTARSASSSRARDAEHGHHVIARENVRPEPLELLAHPVGRVAVQRRHGDELALVARRGGGRPLALAEQPLVQGAQGRARDRAQLVAQAHAHVLVGAQRLGDVAARGERLHQQPVPARDRARRGAWTAAR